jgi:hypothetical protein
VIAGDCTNAFCAGGSDTIDARDGERDTVTCGTGITGGTDTVVADRIDVVGAECASVDLPLQSPAPPPPPPPSPSPPSPSLSLSMSASGFGTLGRLTQQGYVFMLTVSRACAASLKLVVSARSARRSGLGKTAITLASAREAIPQAGTFAARVTADKRYRKKLRSLRMVAARLSLACAAVGHTATASRNISFRR